ncbi:aspartate racemase [Dendryphion nanum]|uniref:Aspartate racemase n=1 Tax=Dendryphion nanum TaxID=256645 RepID=A0A9P9EL42_9PLEO|nr:aspartate racemase [Dendryphion nanum]
MPPPNKIIGILGGMSHESTTTYYTYINRHINERLGGWHSANILLHSFNFAPIVELQTTGQYSELGKRLAKAAARLLDQGAELIIMACNTMHHVSAGIEELGVPFLHIVDAVGEKIKRDEVEKVALLGTRFTMENGFFANRLDEKFGVKTVVPDEKDRILVEKIIWDELGHGVVTEKGRKEYQRIVKDLEERGAQGVILGCTEIGFLLKEGDVDIKLWDTTLVHAEAAAKWAMT